MSPFRQAFEWRVVGGPAIRKRKRKVDRANFKLQIQGNRCWAACLSDCFMTTSAFAWLDHLPVSFIDFLCWTFSHLLQSFNLYSWGFRMFMSTIIYNLQMIRCPSQLCDPFLVHVVTAEGKTRVLINRHTSKIFHFERSS